MQRCKELARSASSLFVFGLLLSGPACSGKNAVQNNEGAKCDKGAVACDGVTMRVCNPSQTGWNEFTCESADTCRAGMPYGQCAENVRDAGAKLCTLPDADCNSNTADGCETNLGTSVTNCGACGHECSSVNGTPRCVAGECHIDCKSHYADCDGDAANGCEVSLDSDSENCGNCGDRCSDKNGTSTCLAGACAVSNCSSGYGDCDGNALNGCEVVTYTNTQNCGGCGKICKNTHGSTDCSAGKCSPTCESGYADCDGDPGNGCETDIRSTAAHCGGCGNLCQGGTRAVCVSGVCDIACEAGKGDCDHDRSNGCETDTLTNPSNCGACGKACTNAHGTNTCNLGACAPTCTPGYADCDGNAANGCETATDTSLDHCGGCGKACSPQNGTAVCSSGSCALTCAANYADCDANPANGCEAYLPGDPKHCGTCSKVCTSVGGTATCSTGVCGVSCDVSHGDCDGNLDTGCETDITTSLAHCGGCGKTCGGAGAAAQCAAGICSLTCNLGYKDCDNNTSNGCEAHITDDAANCGSCGHSCLGGKCTLGVCEPFVLASGQANPTAIAADSTGVYWVNTGEDIADGSVMRLERGSTTPVALATAQQKPCDIALTDTVFWTNQGGGTIMQVAKNGGTPLTLASGQKAPCAIAANADWVVWHDNKTIWKRALIGGAPVTVSTALQWEAFSLVADVDYAYFAAGDIYKAPLSGNSTTDYMSKASLSSILSLALTPQKVCWALETWGSDNVFYVSVMCASKSSSNIFTQIDQQQFIGTNEIGSNRLAVDESHIYRCTNTSIRQAAMTDTVSTSISSAASPRDVAVNDLAVYWTEPASNRVMGIAKP